MWKNDVDECKTSTITLSTNFDSSLKTSESNPALVSLVQSIMAEPANDHMLLQQQNEDEADSNLVISDANDVSSTHDDENVQSAVDQPVVDAVKNEIETFAADEAASFEVVDMQPPVSSSSFAPQNTQEDLIVKAEQFEDEEDTSGPSSNLSPPTTSSALNIPNNFNNDYKSIFQVQQEALLDTPDRQQNPLLAISNDEMLMQQNFGSFGGQAADDERTNKHFEASSLASLLSTAAAADQHHNNLMFDPTTISCANALLSMAGGGGFPNTVRKRSSNTSSDSSGGGAAALPTGCTPSAPAVKKPGGKRKTYACRHGCDIIFKSKEEFWLHNRQHIKIEKALQCPECAFITEYKHHLEYHMRNHRSEKPFKCPQCEYNCVNKSMLNSHLKSHTDIFLFKCAECSYATKYCHSLKLHLKKYKHKAVPRAPRKGAAAAARRGSSAASQQQRNNINVGDGIERGEEAASFDTDDDDEMLGGGVDEDEDENSLMLMETSGEAQHGGENGLMINENGVVLDRQQLLVQFRQKYNPSPLQLPPPQNHGVHAAMPGMAQQLTAMPSELQQTNGLLTTPQQAFDPSTGIFARTPSSNAAGLPNSLALRNGNLASLLSSNGLSTSSSSTYLPLVLPSSVAAGGANNLMTTNRISFSGGSHFLPMQQQQQHQPQFSTSPVTMASQLTNALASLSALNNSVGQNQQQLQQRILVNGGGDHNGIHSSVDVNAIMQLNNPILANALQNVSNKILHSPPQQQQQQPQQQQLSFLQQKVHVKQSPSSSNNNMATNNNNTNLSQQMYGLMNVNGFNPNTPPKQQMLNLQQLQQAAADNAAQQQLQQQQFAFMTQNVQHQPFILNQQQSNDFFQQQHLSAMLSGMNGGNGDPHAGLMMQPQSATDLILTSQPSNNNSLADLLHNAGLVGRLSAVLNNQQQTPASVNGNGAPMSLLATLSQLLNTKQPSPAQQQQQTSSIPFSSFAAASATTTTTTAVSSTKPSPSTISNITSSLQQGFDLTQALNALAQRQNTAAVIAEPPVATESPPLSANKLIVQLAAEAAQPQKHGSFTIHHRAENGVGGGTSSSNNTSSSKELPSSSSSSCSGTSATTTSTARRRKRKGQAFKIDSELRKRLALADMATLEEDDEQQEILESEEITGVQTHSDIVEDSKASGGNANNDASGENSSKQQLGANDGCEKELVSRKNILLAQLRTTSAAAHAQPVKRTAAEEEAQSAAATPPAPAEASSPGTSSSPWSGSYICTHCGIAFLDLTMYSLHMGNHGLNNPFTCNSCGKVTKDKVEFYLHLMCAKRVTAQQLQKQQ